MYKYIIYILQYDSILCYVIFLDCIQHKGMSHLEKTGNNKLKYNVQICNIYNRVWLYFMFLCYIFSLYSTQGDVSLKKTGNNKLKCNVQIYNIYITVWLYFMLCYIFRLYSTQGDVSLKKTGNNKLKYNVQIYNVYIVQYDSILCSYVIFLVCIQHKGMSHLKKQEKMLRQWYIYIYIYVCVCVCVCIYIYIYVYITTLSMTELFYTIFISHSHSTDTPHVASPPSTLAQISAPPHPARFIHTLFKKFLI